MKTALFEALSSAAQFQKSRRSVIFYRFISVQKKKVESNTQDVHSKRTKKKVYIS